MTTTTLNLYIFQLLSYRICYDVISFNRLIELSLLSKSCFKIVQNIITSDDFNKNKFILTLPQFIKYVNKGNDNNDKYKLKLIQYREIKLIRVNVNGMVMDKQVRDKFKYCIKLTKVVLLDTVKCDFQITYDFTFNGFFKVKSLVLYWTNGNIPLAHGEVTGFVYYFGDWKYTFSFLTNYNPSQVIIETSEDKGYQYYDYHGHSDTSLYCRHLENITNFKSIKSIIFKNHHVTKEFIKFVLSFQPHITSLQIGIVRPSSDSIVNEIIGDLQFAGLHGNKTLKSLVITIYPNPNWDVTYLGPDENIDKLITFISTCSTLKKFGLTGIEIDKYDSNVLDPLINSRISTIVTNSNLLPAFIEHIKENSNIKKLHCIDVPNCNTTNDFINSLEYSQCNGLLNNYQHYQQNDEDEDPSILKHTPPLIKLFNNDKNLYIKLNY